MELGQLPQKTFMPEALGAVYYVADFADLSSVRALAAQLKNSYPKIDVLINNAGGLFGERALTVDGHERTFQVNHLAPFLLTNELIEPLLKAKRSLLILLVPPTGFLASLISTT